jgi:hypothetical protein
VQAIPVPMLDRVEHIAHRWNLLSHTKNVRPVLLCVG